MIHSQAGISSKRQEHALLERFRAKREPVRVEKTRRNKSLEEGKGNAVPIVFSKIRRSGPIALFTFLAGCTSDGGKRQIFDYASLTAQAAATIPVKANGRTEKPKVKSASALLGDHQTGAGYAVQPDVLGDGRYNTYTFATEHGTYDVTGDDLARRHIQELVALDALKKYSMPEEFVRGVGSAVVNPVKGVFTTVADPVAAAEGTYTNVGRRVNAVQRGVSRAGEFITTFGKPEKRRPDREDDNLLERLVDRPKARRRLAKALMVDPDTHFVPLASELDKVASYSAAGEFGIKRAIGFIPGGAGTAISGLGTLNSFTDRTLDMEPDEIAAVNRDRLKKLAMPEETIKQLLLTDKLTPTEKTQAVEYLNGLSGTPGLDGLASFLAASDTRHDAFAALQTLRYLSARPFGDEPVSNVDIMDRIPVLTIGDNRKIAVLTSDDLVWTHWNADQLSRLGTLLKGNGKAGSKKEIRISGNASPLAKRELQRQGWIVKTNAFNGSS